MLSTLISIILLLLVVLGEEMQYKFKTQIGDSYGHEVLGNDTIKKWKKREEVYLWNVVCVTIFNHQIILFNNNQIILFNNHQIIILFNNNQIILFNHEILFNHQIINNIQQPLQAPDNIIQPPNN
eukprot:346282_1